MSNGQLIEFLMINKCFAKLYYYYAQHCSLASRIQYSNLCVNVFLIFSNTQVNKWTSERTSEKYPFVFSTNRREEVNGKSLECVCRRISFIRENEIENEHTDRVDHK